MEYMADEHKRVAEEMPLEAALADAFPDEVDRLMAEEMARIVRRGFMVLARIRDDEVDEEARALIAADARTLRPWLAEADGHLGWHDDPS